MSSVQRSDAAVHRLQCLERQFTHAEQTSSVWAHVPQAPADPILGVTQAFQADTDGHRLNLGVGAYRTEEGKPLVLSAVRQAEQRLVADLSRNKEYRPMGGDPTFCKLSRQLAFGVDCPVSAAERIATVQTLSGTGALRVGAEFLKRYYPTKVVYLPDPTWRCICPPTTPLTSWVWRIKWQGLRYVRHTTMMSMQSMPWWVCCQRRRYLVGFLERPSTPYSCCRRSAAWSRTGSTPRTSPKRSTLLRGSPG